MVAGLVIGSFRELPGDISVLVDAERVEGHSLVRRLVDEWEDRTNRFNQPGEVSLEGRMDGRLVAIGGLNRDPYLDDPTVGRVRHVYVHPEVRGTGVGRILVMALIDCARGTFQRVRLRTSTLEGTAFYRAIGFELIDEPAGTHQVVF